MERATASFKIALSFALFSLGFQGATAHAAALSVSQQPLMLVDSVAPNLVFTIDDSGSMRWAFVPDSMGVADNPLRNSRRVKSASYNPMYYNPNIEYLVPVRLNNDGSPAATGYSTSFTAAAHNGFQPTFGTVNLSSSYRVPWNEDINAAQNYTFDSSTNYAAPFGRTYNLAQNPGQDFVTGGTRTVDWRLNQTTCPANTNTYIYDCKVRPDRNFDIDRITINNNTVNRTRTGVPAYYYTFTENCPGGREDEKCYQKVDVPAAQQQNFAIWYSFYRNRALATLSAANLSFNELPPSIRFTWQSLGNCITLNSTGCGDNRFRTYSNRHKANFFNWLSTLKFDQGTPLRASLDRAGKFLQNDPDAFAYNPKPMTSTGATGTTVLNPVLSCRPSYHILMTDGMWNGADGAPSGAFRHDTQSFALPDGRTYDGVRAPYADSTNNTLADLAMHYWATDLRPDIPNDLKPYIRFNNANADTEYWDPRNDPANWQHMVNYTVGLALTNALAVAGLEWKGGTHEGPGYQNLLSGNRNWPAASANNDNNVYDLWHAAINSRGDFFSADSPEELVQSFNDVLNRIAERTATAGKPGVSTSVDVGDDPTNINIVNRLFVSSYDSTDGWEGDLRRRTITRQADGSRVATAEWSAATEITAQGTRNILMAGGTGANNLRQFTWDNLSQELRTLFNINPDSLGSAADTKGAARVAYLRGTRTGEGSNAGDFRIRRSVLGDIINSSPVLVGKPSYVPYLADRIDGKRGQYLNFQRSTVRDELLYVGANDGMLHAIQAGDKKDAAGNVTTRGGREAFAFVPSAVLPDMPALTGQGYKGGAHRFFVDGTPVVKDVFIDSQWRTVLIGTLRAGGKSIFALDITNPGADGSGVKLLWEISNQTTGFNNLGYTFPQPEVVRLHSGQWAVLMGNGYDSANDAASMFVINVATGALIRELVVDNGTGAPNGLSSVRGADNNGDGVVDYAYAGDLLGNLWRFDLVPTDNNITAPDPFARSVLGTVNPASFKVSYGGRPIFTARYPGANGGVVQPITAIPSLVRHPTRRGYIVMVGTGKYFETTDSAPDTTKANSIYGIWDRKTKRETTTAADAGATRAALQQQRITTQTAATFLVTDDRSVNRTIRNITDNAVRWYKENITAAQEVLDTSVNRWGWYVDLNVDGRALDGELMVNEMLARGTTLLFTTNIPNEDPCADGLGTVLYGIDARTGARLVVPPFDFNTDGRIPSGDIPIGSTVPPSGLIFDIPGGIPLTKDGSICDNDGYCIDFMVAPELQGRQSWQLLPVE